MSGKEEDHEMADSGDEDNDDDSSSSEEEVEVDAKDMDRLMKLEASLETNPNQYETHLEYIDLLRKCRLRERLRSARERMHVVFPFSERQWLAWLGDEADAARDLADIERIKGLYQKAAKDYLSVELWAGYLDFLVQMDREVSGRTDAGVEAFRAAAEEAIQAAGLHVTEGGRIWAAYRSYEQAVLDGARGGARDKQAERVRSLWHRQLAVPLVGGDDLMKQYEEWEAATGKGSPPDHVRKSAEKQRQAAALRAAHEAAVSGDKAADAALLAAYLAYIKLEQAQGNPARVTVVFERALAAFPVTAELWQQYTSYLERHVKIPAAVDAAYARALRNCPWVGALWARALRALERGGAGAGRHEEMYDRAVRAGMQGPEDYMEVLLARADYLRRQLPGQALGQATPDPEAAAAATLAARSFFQTASDVMTQYFPDYLDRSLRLPAYWAHVEAHVLKDAAAARAVWEGVLKGPLARYYEPWAAYVATERALRAIPQARGVYRRAWSRKFEEGGQLAVCCDWLRFEREEGSAEDLQAAHLKVDPVLEGASAAVAAATDSHALAVARAAVQQAPKLSKEEVAAMRRAHDPNFKGTKAKKSSKKRDRDGDQEQEQEDATAPSKRSKHPDEPPGKQQQQPAGGGREGNGVAEAMQEDAAAGGDDGDEEAAGQAHQQQQQRPVFDDAHTVFVKGMGHQVGEEDLRRLFADVAGLKEVRVARDHTDQTPRGFAYVEFDSDEGVLAALQKSGVSVRGRTLDVSRSRPPPRGGDDHTAFVKGLGHQVGEEDLRGLFSDAPGGVRGVRAPKNDAGQSKGFAYVEFETAEGLSSAVAKDGCEVKGRKLIIAKSAPPPGGAAAGRGGPGGRGGFGGRGRGRGPPGGGEGRGGGRGRAGLGMPRVPVSAAHGNMGHMRNTLQVQEGAARARMPAMVPRALANAAAGGGAGGGGGGGLPQNDGKAKSNDEFRKMLLGGK